jgi:hypothetical protein
MLFEAGRPAVNAFNTICMSPDAGEALRREPAELVEPVHDHGVTGADGGAAAKLG